MKGQTNKLPLLIMTALIATGCATNTGNTQDTGTGPINVNTFEASPDPASADRRVNVNLELENTGDADAERVAARMFGPTWANGAGDKLAWRDSSGGEVTTEERTLFYDTLRAAGDETPSVPKQKSLTLTAPALSEGREVDYTFQTDIFYQYRTTASTDFKLVSGERFRNEEMERTEATLESSTGPIDLAIRGTTPKIYYKDDQTQGIESEICIKAENTGPGTPFLNGEVDSNRYYEVNENHRNRIRLSIQDISNVDFEAKTEDGGNTVRIDLVNGEEGFQCYTMTADNLGTQEEQNINTQITAQYGYMKEDQTTVTVEGRRGLNQNTETDTNDNQGDGNNNEETDWEWSDSAPSIVTEDNNADEYCPEASQENKETYCIGGGN